MCSETSKYSTDNHCPEVAGSNPVPATTKNPVPTGTGFFMFQRVSSSERLD